MKRILFLISLLTCFKLGAQSYVYGKVFNDRDEPIPYVKVINLVSKDTVRADSAGHYKVPYKHGKRNSLKFEREFYTTLITTIPDLFKDEDMILDIVLKSNIQTYNPGVKLGSDQLRQSTIILKPLSTRPSVSGDFNDYIKSLPGVSSNNELSSQ
ncbi:MAG: hypothetical protein JNM67_06580, partial [Bacteroidetes bacterium]|nr:hypothetical protein [Bacteroidota bacterium]